MDLSNRRAEAVRVTLEAQAFHVTALPPAVTRSLSCRRNDTAANRQTNRRVEIILSEDNARVAPR